MNKDNGKVVWLGERQPQPDADRNTVQAAGFDWTFSELDQVDTLDMPEELWHEAAAGDLFIATVIHEQVKRERESTERTLARLNERLDRLDAEAERHWSTRMARWWRALWNR